MLIPSLIRLPSVKSNLADLRGRILSLRWEIRSSVKHEITLKRVKQWLNGGARARKRRLRKNGCVNCSRLNKTYLWPHVSERMRISSLPAYR